MILYVAVASTATYKIRSPVRSVLTCVRMHFLCILRYLWVEVQKLFECSALFSVILNDFFVLPDKPPRALNGECYLIARHAVFLTQHDLAKRPDIVLNGLVRMVGIPGYLFDGVLFDEELMNDDAFVGKR